jgi:phosphoribosylformimino-5-aminoimidazole carboxamide ribotide isomerase
MLIPSIDLMGGRVVQLEQGARLALESNDLDGWIARFTGFPIVQLIDLDAAMGRGDNAALVRRVAAALPCQVGGGVRTVDSARELLDAGARRVIVGSALFDRHGVNVELARQFRDAVGTDALIGAVDARRGRVVTHGWTQEATVSPLDAIRALAPFVGGFLHTDVEREGLLQGFDVDGAAGLRGATARRLIVAGGIRRIEEVDELDRLGIDAVVGMAIYRGLIDISSHS